MNKKIRYMLTVFSFLFVHLAAGNAEARMQINTSAMQGDTFLENFVIDFVITDNLGRKVGYDPITKQRYKEFDAGYGSTGIDYLFSAEAYLIPTEGVYTFEIFGGDAPSSFTMEIGIMGDAHAGFGVVKAKGVLDKGLSAKFELTYTIDPSKPAGGLVRIATPSSLKQDIITARKVMNASSLYYIDNDGLMKSLLAKADAAEASIAKGNKTAAINQLEALINEVAAQSGKHLTDEAARMLKEDAQYLLEQLK